MNFLDISKIELIRNASIYALRDIDFVENLLLRLGLNNEILSEFPEELYQYTGYGLFHGNIRISLVNYWLN